MTIKYIKIGGLGTFPYDDTYEPWAIDTDGGISGAGIVPADILAALLSVAGAGSRLDADLLDGQHGSVFYLKEGGPIGDGVNYTEFASDGTLTQSGTATTFNDLQGSVLSLKQLGSGVSTNSTENTAEFTTEANLSDYLYDNYQLNHAWLLGSDLNLHIHWEQTSADTPNMLARYRWQKQGDAKTSTWTDHVIGTNAFTYPGSGTINQISHGDLITPPTGYGLSDVVQIRVLRDNSNASGLFAGADSYAGAWSISFIDIHIQTDALGSNTEFSK